MQVRVSSVIDQARVTADEPVLVDYSSSAYRPVPDAPELDLLEEEEEQVHMISLKEQASLEVGMFADWGNNTESALASTNDKHRLFKYVCNMSHRKFADAQASNMVGNGAAGVESCAIP
jgi:hypothetical protein